MNSWMPHSHCVLGSPVLIWTMVISNAVISIAYFTIPINLVRVGLLKKAMLVKKGLPLLLLWASFIFLCGLTHASEIVTMWIPLWWMDTIICCVTAIVSILTAILWYKFIHGELNNSYVEEYDNLQKKIDELKSRI